MPFGVLHCPHPECPFLDLALSSSSPSLTPLTPLACAQPSTSSQIHKAGLFLPASGPLRAQPPVWKALSISLLRRANFHSCFAGRSQGASSDAFANFLGGVTTPVLCPFSSIYSTWHEFFPFFFLFPVLLRYN